MKYIKIKLIYIYKKKIGEKKWIKFIILYYLFKFFFFFFLGEESKI
jgi:hypothetical protein